jgi:hypothetical protein
MANLGELVISMSADVARLQSDMGKGVSIIDKASKDMASALGVVTKAFSLIGIAAAGLGGGKLFGNIVQETVDWSENIRKLGNTFGVTTEEASVFETAIAKLGIDHETAINAALRLSRTLAQGTDKFDDYGVSIKDANGNLLPMPEIMANVNQALLQTQSGADRNTMAMTLYGRSWGQLQEILRLTPEKMAEAQATAERLHLIVGPDGAQKILQYKESVNELELAIKAMKMRVGDELVPEMTRLAVAMSGFAEGGMISGFVLGLHSVEAEVRRLAMLLDKLGGTATTAMYYLAGGKFTDSGKWWAEQNKMFEERYNAQDKELLKLAYLEVGLDENGNPIKKKTQDLTGERINVGAKGSAKEMAAANAYLAYLKAFYESIAQEQKQANDAEEQLNQIAWNWGLVSLKDYLDKKHALNEVSLQIELDAKQKELTAAQETEKKALALYNANPTDEMAAKVNKSYETTQKAIMAVNAAEAKLQQARTANADETKRDLYDQTKGLSDLTAQILDLTGQYEKAAKARTDFYRASPEYLRLSPEEKKQKDIIDNFSVFQSRQREQSVMQGWQFGNRAIANRIPDIFGNMAGPQADLKLRYDQEIAAVQAEIDKMNALYMQDTDNYRLALEKKRLLDEKYKADSTRLEMEKWTSIGGIVENQLGQIAGMMNKNDRDQFEAWKALAIGQAIISTALAVVGILGAESKLGIYAIPLAYMAGAIGAAQVGIIAGQQYQGREYGGAVNAGQPYIVGEKGPELFTPGASGMITPGGKLGSPPVINQNFHFAAGTSEEIKQQMRAMASRAKEEAKSEIYSSMQRGGSFAYASGRVK